MRYVLVSVFILLQCLSAGAQITETAFEAVANMGVGWNLGNTLDANKGGGKDFGLPSYWGGEGLESENYWGQPTTTPELFAMMKNAGFGAIRVPVTWYNHSDESGNVRREWMQRVHEVVDYVVGNGLYCIINVHHDTGADSNGHTSWIKADEGNFQLNKQRYENLWRQIAEEFRGYDHHLLFEAYNEMLDVNSSWCFASFNTPSQYDLAMASSAYNGINAYAQSFVSTVRATGGNNASRNLIVNTYAAANGYGTWNAHLKEPIDNMLLPDDTAEGHLIFEVHDYPAISQTSNGKTTDRPLSDIKSQIDTTIRLLKSYLVSQGAPVIIGEWGTSNVDSGAGKTDYDVRRDLMLDFADYYVSQCKANGIATFFWMGLTDGAYRSLPAFSQPDLAERIVKAYHGEGFQGVFPDVSTLASYVAFEGDKALGWGDGITIPGAYFKMVGSDALLQLTYKQTGGTDDIQLYYGDWSSKPSFSVDGRTYSGDFVPHAHYASPTGSEHVTTIAFAPSLHTLLQQKGLIIHGSDITLSKAELVNPTGISGVVSAPAVSRIYTLTGLPLSGATLPHKGVYIIDGKKRVR